MNNNIKILYYCAALEVCYLLLSFAIAEHYGQWSDVGEILRTGLRLAVIGCYGYCFRRYFYNGAQTGDFKTYLASPFALLVCLFLLIAAINSNAENETLRWQTVFAVSGITAGLREELFYRGLVQQYFAFKYDERIALTVASAFFTMSHIQYIFHGQLPGLLLIMLAGIIFGGIYIYTRSIVITALIHGLYDAILSIKISTVQINNNTALMALLVITSMFLLLINKQLKTIK
ncbi:hypothetical protein MCAMS1_00650 [biofilm metagenome]